MREYLVFSILIFIPVAIAMYFLLRREIKNNADIGIIIGLAFLVIITFPFIIQKIGWIGAVIIYLLLLYGLSQYLIRKIDICAAVSIESKEDSYLAKEYVNVNVNDDMKADGGTKITAEEIVTLPALADYEPIPEQADSAEESLLSSETTTEPEIDTGEEAVESSNADNEPVQDIFPSPEGPESISELTAAALDRKDELNAESAISSSEETQEIAENIKELIAAQENSEPLEESKEDTLTEHELMACAAELLEESAEESEPGEESYQNSDLTAVIAEPPNAAIDTTAEETKNRQEKIEYLIDQGFYYKAENNYAAAVESFIEVLDLTAENGLKYILLKEVIYLLKQTGQYNKAIALIQSFLTTEPIKADIMRDIQNELDYLLKLIKELEHLKLTDLPIAQVPRWIKIKLNS